VAAIARSHGAVGHTLAELLEHVSTNAHVLAELAPRIALGVLPVLAVLDPEVVVLGGPTGIAGGHRLAELVHEQIVSFSRWRPSVVASAVGAHPVLSGAREVLLGEIRSRLHNDVNSLTA
jgi:predicted NBD/HSP70 family sugar kinase